MRQHDWGIVPPLGIVPADRTQNIPIIAAGDTTIVHCPFSIPQILNSPLRKLRFSVILIAERQ